MKLLMRSNDSRLMMTECACVGISSACYSVLSGYPAVRFHFIFTSGKATELLNSLCFYVYSIINLPVHLLIAFVGSLFFFDMGRANVVVEQVQRLAADRS